MTTLSKVIEDIKTSRFYTRDNQGEISEPYRSKRVTKLSPKVLPLLVHLHLDELRFMTKF